MIISAAMSALRRSSLIPCLLVAMIFGANQASATTVFLDYTDFETRLIELTTSASVPSFSAAEVATIKSGILSTLDAAYSGTDLVFSEVDPGGLRATIDFSETAPPSELGVAEHIDFFNRDLDDVALVYTANFDFIIEASDPRATQISELGIALGGTSAHELGHNLGLRHHDAYGNLVYLGSPIATGGAQNNNIMATGMTGLSELGRETVRGFSDLSKVKLAFADTVLETTGLSAVSEAGAPNDSFGTAQLLTLTNNTYAGKAAAAVDTAILAGPDTEDWYAVALEGGSALTADINVDYSSTTTFDNVNTIIEVYDTDGTSLLASDLVSVFSGNTYGSGTFGDGFDPAVFNVPISADGTYFVRVLSESGSDVTGEYNLLVYSDLIAVTSLGIVPEPASGLLSLLGLAMAFRRRRNR